jgi:hypothetical protein
MGVERKNFDFALLKVMGADRAFVVANILAGALKYVALANLLAYPLAYAALYGVTTAFEGFFGYRHEISPTSDAVFGGLFIGMLVPVISAVAPIWRVIRNDLAENLNPLRSQVEGTRTEVYVEGREFPTGKVLFGLLAAGYGLMIYYLLPRAPHQPEPRTAAGHLLRDPRGPAHRPHSARLQRAVPLREGGRLPLPFLGLGH